MNKKDDFNFEWLPGFREMMACQNNTMADGNTITDNSANSTMSDNSVMSDNNTMPGNSTMPNNSIMPDNSAMPDSSINAMPGNSTMPDSSTNAMPGNSTMPNNNTNIIAGSNNQNTSNIDKLLPPEQLQQEEQQYWKDYEYLIQLLPLIAREVWVVTDALLDQYEYTGSSIYLEYPDKVTILKIVDMVYDKLKYHEQQETMQADDETVIRNPYFMEESMRDSNTPFRTLIQVMLHWNINYRRQRYYRRQRVFSKY